MIRFLTEAEVIAEQEQQLAVFGGGEPGILNQNTLGSAVAQPQASFGGNFLYEDLFAMATAYLIGLVKGHAFCNGNKRIGLSSTLMFLYLNGQLVVMSEQEAIDLVLLVISGEVNREAAAQFLRSHAHQVEEPRTAESNSVEQASRWVQTNYSHTFSVLAQ